MSSNNTQEYELYKNSLILKTEQLITMELPVRILELNEFLKEKKPILFKPTILEAYNFIVADVAAAAAGSSGGGDGDYKPTSMSSKRTRRDNIATKSMMPHGWIPCNKSIYEVSSMLKPIVDQFLMDVISIRMWISYLMPRNEDSNRLHMEIIDDILIAEMEATKFFNQNTQYYQTRSKLSLKKYKYPFIEDYLYAIIELDDEHSMSLWLLMNVLRNHYATFHDKITKNLDVLKASRPSDMEQLY